MIQVKPFHELGISDELLFDIEKAGYAEPTPIQSEAIPVAVSGRDILGQAHTGTGKTAAFSIPMIMQIEPKKHIVQGLVITPTRELCVQVAGEVYKFGKGSRIKELPVYGGQPIDHQIRGLKQNPHIIIGTPGRLIDHVKRGTLDLSQVKMVVLDEADEMLDMGFIQDIEYILSRTNPERQTMLFSATVPSEIKRISKRYMNNPEHISVIREGEGNTATDIEQVFYEVPDVFKLEALCRLLDFESIEFAIIFCRTKKECGELENNLKLRGYLVEALHGDLNQNQRNKVMDKFKRNKLEYLVATDVAARGIDVSNVTHVINYHIPQNPEDYIHRIGRTGRAGNKGTAITLSSPREFASIRAIQRLTKSKIERKQLPTVSEMLEKQQESLRTRIVKVLETEALERYQEIVTNLSEEISSEKLSTALLKLYFDDKQVVLDEINTTGRDYANRGYGAHKDFSGRGNKKNELFLNVGKDDGADVPAILGSILDESDVPKSTIGRIKILDRFSFVQIVGMEAADMIPLLRNLNIDGRPVRAQQARESRGGSDRKRGGFNRKRSFASSNRW